MKYRKNNDICKNENGVIMLETLISLPVYLVILSGVFWLGELCLARQGLTGADRLRLYESACRHITNRIAERDIFSGFDSLPSTRPQLVTGASGLNFNGNQTETQSMGWCVTETGHSTLTVRRSEWSWGIGNFLFSATTDGSENTINMISYGTNEQLLDSFLVSRSHTVPDHGIRSGENPYNNVLNWFRIASGTDCTDKELNDDDLYAISEYSRNTALDVYLPAE